MQKQLKMGVMAAFVAAALSGCGEAPSDGYSYSGLGGEATPTVTATSPEQCSNMGGGSLEQCQLAFKQAKDEHIAAAPKFNDQSSCESGTDAVCSRTQIQNSDGSFSDVFVPAMVGMIVGQMMSNNTRPMPVYAPSRHEDRKNGFVTANGAYVPPGKGSVGASTFKKSSFGSSFTKPVASSKPVMKMSSGGFGKSGSFGSSGG
ncbi:hypothetical protein OFDDKENP_00075 [Aeromonas phage B614]|nr:hypothetical protein OFDDKENP_00075 [Aeromonas phage B614]UYD58199.1 hypothetical protein JNEOFJEA_00102 [Aeromonas phage UP87]UYD58562.1 hypothetical protein IPAKJDPM_00219 [Aeromonas phage avDM14-QBC]UYD58776.1 hypothetical protein HNNIDBEH_00183 [Aeromonas phage avDM10-HWA]UYD58920.1 hypothetical protein OFOPOMKI_00070 [Aeromonas phage avDM7-IJDJ]UYD59979.1 hypothetical protein LEHPIFIF_00223 [Aeromonas phage avDM9-HANS]